MNEAKEQEDRNEAQGKTQNTGGIGLSVLGQNVGLSALAFYRTVKYDAKISAEAALTLTSVYLQALMESVRLTFDREA